MIKYLRISSYIGKPFLIYDFAPDPIKISLYMRKISLLFHQWYWFLSMLQNFTWVMYVSWFMCCHREGAPYRRFRERVELQDQAFASPPCFESRQGHHYEETWPRSSSSQRNRIWPPRWEASTLERSHSNSLLVCYSEPQHACPSASGHHIWTNTGRASSNVCYKSNKLLSAFTRIALQWMHHEYQALAGPRVFNHVGVTTMKRLDKGHLHPTLEVTRLACPGQESNPPSAVGAEHSRKEPFNSLLISYSVPLQYCISGNRGRCENCSSTMPRNSWTGPLFPRNEFIFFVLDLFG